MILSYSQKKDENKPKEDGDEVKNEEEVKNEDGVMIHNEKRKEVS